jgi:beta-glucosidase
MKNLKFTIYMATVLVVLVTLGSCKKWSETGSGSIMIVTNKGGQTLGYDTTSGVKILTTNGYAFKDLNKNGKLDVYEDWRMSADERAHDLASKMTIEQIAGLMLYSAHQAIRGLAEVHITENLSMRVELRHLTSAISRSNS